MLNREFYCIEWELPSVHVTSKQKELRLSSCGSLISSKGTEASRYLGNTVWMLNPPLFVRQTRNISTIQQ